MLKRFTFAFFCISSIPLAAHDRAAQIDEHAHREAVVDSLAYAGETCAVGKRQERKMLAYIEERGFERDAAAELKTHERVSGRSDPAGLTLYSREGVRLAYFHSRYMRTCDATHVIGPDFDIGSLLANLSQRLGKDPKVETPGKKYLFPVKGAILTVQIKQSEGEATISLATVRT